MKSFFSLDCMFGPQIYNSVSTTLFSPFFLCPPINSHITLQICISTLQGFFLWICSLFLILICFILINFQNQIFFLNFILLWFFYSVRFGPYFLFFIFLIMVIFYLICFSISPSIFFFRFNAHSFYYYFICLDKYFKLRFVFRFHPSTLNWLMIELFNWTRVYDFMGCEFKKLTYF
jgi:hypothetical protein